MANRSLREARSRAIGKAFWTTSGIGQGSALPPRAGFGPRSVDPEEGFGPGPAGEGQRGRVVVVGVPDISAGRGEDRGERSLRPFGGGETPQPRLPPGFFHRAREGLLPQP